MEATKTFTKTDRLFFYLLIVLALNATGLVGLTFLIAPMSVPLASMMQVFLPFVAAIYIARRIREISWISKWLKNVDVGKKRFWIIVSPFVWLGVMAIPFSTAIQGNEAKNSVVVKLESYEEKLKQEDYIWLSDNLSTLEASGFSAEANEKGARKEYSDTLLKVTQYLQREDVARKVEDKRQAEYTSYIEDAKKAESAGEVNTFLSLLGRIPNGHEFYDEAQSLMADLHRKRKTFEEASRKEQVDGIWKNAEEAKKNKDWQGAMSLLEGITEQDPSYQKAKNEKVAMKKLLDAERKKTFMGAWNISTDVSKMDDTKTVILSLSANNTISGWPSNTYNPTLIIRCQENKTEVYVRTGMSADVEYGDGRTVEIRLDEGRKTTQRWSESTDREALFAPNAVGLAKNIAGAEKMYMRFTPFNSPPQLIEFNVDGLYSHLGQVAQTCGWRYSSPYGG